MLIDFSFRRSLLVASALGGVFGSVAMVPGMASAQSGTPAAGSLGTSSGGEVTFPNSGAHPAVTANQPANSEQSTETTRVNVIFRKLLLREKNSPSAVTELGANQIAQVGVQGSVSTLLRQAPSINVYQQGIGNNEPVISIRGARGLETAETLDDIPTQDLLNGGTGGFLTGVVSGRFNLDQIQGVSIYPGVAYPDKNTFGTIGGTIAYDSLRPSNDRYVDVTASVGSFQTFQEGVTLNSGAIDGPLGSGYNAPSFLAKYENLSTQGFIDYTPAHYNDFEFAADKPYDDGLSKVQATILYNTGNALITPEPVPLPYLNKYGRFSNYAPSSEFFAEQNDYLSIYLKDRTYINQYLTVGGSVFYLPTDQTNVDYNSVAELAPNGLPGSETVGGASPFIQTNAAFGFQSLYVPGGQHYQPPFFTFNGPARFPPGSPGCPAATANQFTAAGLVSPCGQNNQTTVQHTDTYGIQPRITFTPPDIAGIRNTIIVGALVAKETSPYVPIYSGVGSSVAQTSANLLPNFSGGLSSFDGGEYRAIYQGFAQDKIDLFHNTLHVTPGVTLETTSTGDKTSELFGGTPSAAELATPYCTAQAAAGSPCAIGSYKVSRFDRIWLPFANVAYDLDRVLPAAKGTSLYGSFGESALFAPVSDFAPTIVGTTPYPAVVHLYEAGVRYNTSNVSLSADYFYQHVTRDFGFFQFQNGPDAGREEYTNSGQREFKGQEISAVWQVNPHWQLFLNGSHILAKYLQTALEFTTVQEDQFGLGIRGSPISGIPAWISTFGVDYDHKSVFLQGDEAHIRFEGQYTGRQYTTIDVSPGLGTGPNIGPLPGVAPFGTYQYYSFSSGSTITNNNNQLAAYIVFNLDANYSLPAKYFQGGFLKKVDFDLNILNLFNKQYYQYYYAQISPGAFGNFPANAPPQFAGQSRSPYSGLQFQDALPGEPFAATFTITARF